MIFYRVGEKSKDKAGNSVMWDLKQRIDAAVFPGHQGGPHNHTITALTVALGETMRPEYKAYQQAVLDNCQAMAKALVQKGFKLVSGGSDNHLVLVNLNSKELDGGRFDAVLEKVNIVANKNTIPGDRNALLPKGIRFGTPAMTSRGFGPREFEQTVEFIDNACEITRRIKMELPAKHKIADFKQWLKENSDIDSDLVDLKKRVTEFSMKYPFPYEI